MSKFNIISDFVTNDVIDKLNKWDLTYGVEVSGVKGDCFNVKFISLPNDLTDLAQEVYELCPNVIYQGFGCMDDMIEIMTQSGREIEPEIAELIKEIDIEDEDFSMKIIQKYLKFKKINYVISPSYSQ